MFPIDPNLIPWWIRANAPVDDWASWFKTLVEIRSLDEIYIIGHAG
jgi:hypothetical protein